MKIEGHFKFPAPAQEVWDLLTDPQSLQHCTPGCKQLTEIAADEFEATMEVGIGPIKGTFHGKIAMKEKAPPRSYRLIIEGSGGRALFAAKARSHCRTKRATRPRCMFPAMAR